VKKYEHVRSFDKSLHVQYTKLIFHSQASNNKTHDRLATTDGQQRKA